MLTSSLVALAEDDAVAAVAACLDLVQELDGDTDNELAVIDAFNSTTKPVALLANLHSAINPEAAARLRSAGVPVLEGTRTGLLAMKHLLEWRDRHGRHGRLDWHDRHGAAARAKARSSGLDDVRQAHWLARLASGPIAGADAFGLLAAYGIGAVPAVAVSDRAAAVEAANRLGYPVVLKTDEPAIAHKSDVGGVVLGLAGGDDVGGAFDDLAERLGKRVLVAATAPDGVELSLGLVRDPQLGPLVVVGAGGILVELLGDRAVGLPPIDRDLALRLIGRLGVRRLLDGVRGQPAADLEAVVDAVVAVSVLAEELSGGLEALDINPLRCGPAGVVALDALVVARGEAAPLGLD